MKFPALTEIIHRRLTISIIFILLFCSSSLLGQQVQNTIKSSIDTFDNFGGDEYDDSDEDLYADTLSIMLHRDSFYFAPAYETYYFWDTLHIQPYRVDFSNRSDTVLLILQDDGSVFCQPVKGRVTSEFGYRWRRFHYGIDLDLNTGDTVLCAFDGMTRITLRHPTYGNVVIVRHYNGLETVYAHLSKFLVYPNEQLRAGDIIGLGGSTGRSTGPHLHFELRYLGNAINPRKVIDFDTFALKSDSLLISKELFKYQADARSVRYYTVKNGDTLSRIAKRYGVSVKKLCALNHISTNTVLRPGRKIRIN